MPEMDCKLFVNGEEQINRDKHGIAIGWEVISTLKETVDIKCKKCGSEIDISIEGENWHEEYVLQCHKCEWEIRMVGGTG